METLVEINNSNVTNTRDTRDTRDTNTRDTRINPLMRREPAAAANASQQDAVVAASVLSPLFASAAVNNRLPTLEEAQEALNEASVGHMSTLADACVLLASALPTREVAAMVGLSPAIIRSWQRLPAFRKAVQDCFNAHRNIVYVHALIDQQRRVMRLASRIDALDNAIDARAERYINDPTAPEEAHTGLFQEEVVFNARTGEERRIFKLDAPLARELREIEKQAAIETGQWASDDPSTAAIKLYAKIDVAAVLGQSPPPQNAQLQVAHSPVSPVIEQIINIEPDNTDNDTDNDNDNDIL